MSQRVRLIFHNNSANIMEEKTILITATTKLSDLEGFIRVDLKRDTSKLTLTSDDNVPLRGTEIAAQIAGQRNVIHVRSSG